MTTHIVFFIRMIIFVIVMPLSVFIGMSFHDKVDKYVEKHNTWYMLWVITLFSVVAAFILTVWRWCIFDS